MEAKEAKLDNHLPENHRLSLSDVSVTVRAQTGSWWQCGSCRRQTKTILKNINITARSGDLVALTGNSGSGKSSLLNVIANRHSGDVDGSILFDGKKFTEQRFSRHGAYVIQNDRLLANLTVRETVLYAGRLAFAGKCSEKEIDLKVDDCIKKVGLQHVEYSRVGGLINRGISGGERRRLSVAVQLLRDPAILLLDEPTTGLDSFTAHYLVTTLATIAHHDNRMVILSIHQPRSDIFRLLDTVCMLSAGSVVYYGPRTQLVPYFTKIGHPCPIYSNPLDYYVDLASMDYRSALAESKTDERLQVLIQAYTESTVYSSVLKQSDAHIEHQSRTDSLKDQAQLDENKSNKNNCCFRCRQFFSLWAILLSRMYVHIIRDRQLVVGRVVNLLSYAAMVWLYCWVLGHDFRSIQDRVGLIYQTTAVSCAVGCMTAYTNFPVLRDLYYRESSDGLYGCIHFLAAYYVYILPFQVLSAFGFSVWAYWGCGLNPDVGRFFIFGSVVLIQQHLGELQTLGCMALIYNPDTARALANMIITLSMQYASGLIRSADELIPPLKQMTYVNHYKYASEIMIANEMAGLQFECLYPAPNCTVSGDTILSDMYGPEAADNVGRNFGILFALTFGYWSFVIISFLIRGRKVLH